MLLYSDKDNRLRLARQAFSLVPLVVFLTTLILFAMPNEPSLHQFTQMLLRALVAALASAFVCIGAYGFYRYLIERSPGL
ncbi:MAG TPA: hypothetical protein VEW94_00975 [Chloroflexia bacterium]|nr:hypothetical protein [Chloroflexia bacterium]